MPGEQRWARFEPRGPNRKLESDDGTLKTKRIEGLTYSMPAELATGSMQMGHTVVSPACCLSSRLARRNHRIGVVLQDLRERANVTELGAKLCAPIVQDQSIPARPPATAARGANLTAPNHNNKGGGRAGINQTHRLGDTSLTIEPFPLPN
jgi:hypothetical protein